MDGNKRKIVDNGVTKSARISQKRPMSRPAFAVLVGVTSLLLGFVGPLTFFLTGWLTRTDTVNSETVVSQEGDVISKVAGNVGPSVVSILTEAEARSPFGYLSVQKGAGTGIIISSDGYIVTNKHVVSSATKNIEIVLPDGKSYKGVKFVGSDPSNDVAFLKISNVKDLPAAKLGDSSGMQVGQKVIAIGNALGEYQNTVTTGIISALGRPVVASDATGTSAEQLENLLQTDAAINPGNSGGPLVNFNGEVIGITTAIASNAQGIGFAIPINDVKGMVKILLGTGKVVKPFAGVRYVSITPDVVSKYNLTVENGAYLVGSGDQPAIVADGPAEKAGLKEKDIITKVGDKTVDSKHPFASLIAQLTPGEKVTITYVRDGKTATTELTVGSRSQ